MSTRTPSQSSWLSVGLRMCVSVTVLSTRTVRPPSTLPPRASSISTRLIRSHTSARTTPMHFCSADFFRGRNGSTRAKCFADAESSSANSRSR